MTTAHNHRLINITAFGSTESGHRRPAATATILWSSINDTKCRSACLLQVILAKWLQEFFRKFATTGWCACWPYPVTPLGQPTPVPCDASGL